MITNKLLRVNTYKYSSKHLQSINILHKYIQDIPRGFTLIQIHR